MNPKIEQSLLLGKQLMDKENEYKRLSMEITRTERAGLSAKKVRHERDEVLEEIRLIRKAIKGG